MAQENKPRRSIFSWAPRKAAWGLALTVAAGLLLLAACGDGEEEEVAAPEAPPPEVVTVEVPVEAFPPGTELRILQWSHFVEQYDVWFDPFAKAWGDANGVKVTVDHINLTELPAATAAEIAAGEGHTLIERLFPVSAILDGLHDLTDVNLQAQELFGEQQGTCTASSFLPAADTWYGFCHGWIPDPADYNRALWSQVGFPDGPETWDDLLVGGAAIKDQFDIPLGIGLSPELDSRMAARAIIWSYGGSLQDENECVVLNSPEVIEAVKYMAELFDKTMTDEVFAWTPGSNNQGLIAGELSYILNSISAYRTLQEIDAAASDDIFFGPALKGPGGGQYASSHVWQIYVVPNFVEEAELAAAKAFMLHLTANYNQAVFHSKLYNFPGFPSTVPQLFETYESTHFGEQPSWLDADPYGSRPADKLNVLRTALDWTVHIGWPGVANPAISQVFAESLLVTMMSQVALGEKTAEEAVADTAAQIEAIFDDWRDQGLVGECPS